MPADGWLEVIGYGDGGGSCKHTYVKTLILRI